MFNLNNSAFNKKKMRWPYIISLIALLGAGLLLFFNVLCGASTSSVLGKWYWLQAETENIPGANPVTRWTNYNSCGVSNGRNVDCSGSSAAYPMSPVSNFGTTEGVPSGLTSQRGVTYYLSKTGWAFLLIGLLFTILALLPVAISFCLPSLTALNIVTALSTNAALLFTALSASLLTAGYVKARNAFRNDGSSTSLGRTMLGFIWASVALLAISSLLSNAGCLGNFLSKRKDKKRRYSQNYDSSSHDTYGNNYVHEKNTTRGGFFSRNKKPTNEAALDDVGYGAGVGASGATSDYTRTGGTAIGDNTGTNRALVGAGVGTAAVAGTAAGVTALGDVNKPISKDVDNDARIKGQDLDDVGIAAGIGASGTTSKYATGTTGTTDTTGTTGATGATGAAGTTGATGSKTTDSRSKDLEEIGYAAGYGASGATSDITKNPSGYGVSSSGSTAPYDKSRATGIGADPSYRNAIIVGDDENYAAEGTGSNKGLAATAAAALGFGTVGAAATSGDKSEVRDYTHDNSGSGAAGATGATRGATDIHYHNPGIDSGHGATREGENSERLKKKQQQEYENKSTVLPVSGSKHINKDAYGNETVGYEKGVPDNAAAVAANAAIDNYSSTGYNQPIYKDPASTVKDTYKNVPSSKRKDDLTDTTGYEPTNYYSTTTKDDFNTTGDAGVATINAPGATSALSGSEKSNPSKDLDKVAESAGYGASGATSDYIKDQSHHTKSQGGIRV